MSDMTQDEIEFAVEAACFRVANSSIPAPLLARAVLHLFGRVKELEGALDPEMFETIADEIPEFKHSARAASLRVIARDQRAALQASKKEG